MLAPAAAPGPRPRRPARALDRDAARTCRKRPFTTHTDRLRPRLEGGRLPVAGLDSCVRALRPGDVLVVWKLDRLGRSLAHLINTVQAPSACGLGLRVLTGQGAQIDTTTAAAASCSASSRRWPSSNGSFGVKWSGGAITTLSSATRCRLRASTPATPLKDALSANEGPAINCCTFETASGVRPSPDPAVFLWRFRARQASSRDNDNSDGGSFFSSRRRPPRRWTARLRMSWTETA